MSRVASTQADAKQMQTWLNHKFDTESVARFKAGPGIQKLQLKFDTITITSSRIALSMLDFDTRLGIWTGLSLFLSFLGLIFLSRPCQVCGSNIFSRQSPVSKSAVHWTVCNTPFFITRTGSVHAVGMFYYNVAQCSTM